jgi:hypothetical protein
MIFHFLFDQQQLHALAWLVFVLMELQLLELEQWLVLLVFCSHATITPLLRKIGNRLLRNSTW